MPLLSILVTIIIVGVLLWGIQRIPMEGTVKNILTTVVIVCLVLWLLSFVVNLGSLGNVRIGK